MFVLLASLSAGLLLVPGCGKPAGSSPASEAPITGQPSDPPVEMKAEWKPGHRYLLHLEMNQSAVSPWGRQTAPQETSVGQDCAITVTNAPGGGRGLELEIQSLAVESGSGENTWLRFDSLNKVTPSEGPGVEQLEKLIGGRVRLLLDAGNKVVAVDGLKELAARAEDSTGNVAANTGGKRGGRAVGGMTAFLIQRISSADYFKQIVETSSLPQGAVRIGDSWTVQKEMPGNLVGTLVVNTTNILRGWQNHDNRNCARVEFAGALAIKPGRPENLTFGASTKLEDGQISGTSWFSPDVGFPIERTFTQSYTVTGMRTVWTGGPRRSVTNAPVRATNAPMEKFVSPNRLTISVKLLDVQSLEQTPATKPVSQEKK